MVDMTEEQLQALYAWIDEVPLSRQKKNITRDFSDGVLAAEVVHHFLPKVVEQHNYTPANSTTQKLDNWRTLNRKVFARLNFSIPDDLLQSVSVGKPGVIEFILQTLRTKIEKFLENRAKRQDSYSDGAYYDPTQLVAGYDSAMESWHQDAQRHPGPALPPPEMVSYPTAHSNPAALTNHHHTLISKIPRAVKSNSVSAPSRTTTLPPINLPQGGGASSSTSRGHSNPERNKYAHNPSRNPPPRPALTRPVDNATGVKLKLAEKDQRILESQEYIQFLQMKVTRLEHLVQIKDLKINDLKRQLDVVQLERHHHHHQAHPLQRKH